jgi:hypothetical protein
MGIALAPVNSRRRRILHAWHSGKLFFAPLESSFCLKIPLSVNRISYSQRAGRQPNFGCQNRAWQPNGSGISQAMTGLQNSAIETSL